MLFTLTFISALLNYCRDASSITICDGKSGKQNAISWIRVILGAQSLFLSCMQHASVNTAYDELAQISSGLVCRTMSIVY